MTTPNQDPKSPPPSAPSRNTDADIEQLRAKGAALGHAVEGARDVAAAKAKAAVADAKVAAAEKKREVQQRIDDARIEAQNPKANRNER